MNYNGPMRRRQQRQNTVMRLKLLYFFPYFDDVQIKRVSYITPASQNKKKCVPFRSDGITNGRTLVTRCDRKNNRQSQNHSAQAH